MSRDYRRLMEDIAQSRQAFAKALREARAARPEPRGFRKNGSGREPRHLTAAKEEQALEAARQDLAERSLALFEALKMEELKLGLPSAVEEAIAFLEADVPGHRLGSGWGYLRGSVMRRLKGSPLKPTQIYRLQKIALKMCLGQSYRQEIHEAARLMIRLADEDFAARLAQVLADPGKSGQGAHQAALLMAHRLAHHRPELKPLLFP